MLQLNKKKFFSPWPFEFFSTLAVPDLQSALITKFPSFQKDLLTVLKQGKKEQKYRNLILFWKQMFSGGNRHGFNPQAGRGEKTLGSCLKSCVSPNGESRDHTVGSEAGDGEQACKDPGFFLFALFQNSQQAGIREPSSLGPAGSPRSWGRCLLQIALRLSLHNAKRETNK